MNTNDTVTFAITGQSLTTRFLQGRPSSVSFQVFRDVDSDISAPQFSGTATVDTFSTALSAAAGYGQTDPTLLTVASTASLTPRRKYLLSGSGQSEWVEVVRTGTLQLFTRQPVNGRYASADTLVSTYASAAVDATFIADVNKLSDLTNPWADYRIKWTAVIGGVTVVQYGYFDVTRAPVKHNVDIEDVNLRVPGLRDSMPTDYRNDNGYTLIESAWRSAQADLAAIDIAPDAIHNAQVVDELLILKCKAILAEGGWRPLGIELSQFYEMTRDTYNRFFEKNFQIVARHSMQATTGGDGFRGASSPIWVR